MTPARSGVRHRAGPLPSDEDDEGARSDVVEVRGPTNPRLGAAIRRRQMHHAGLPASEIAFEVGAGVAPTTSRPADPPAAKPTRNRKRGRRGSRRFRRTAADGEPAPSPPPGEEPRGADSISHRIKVEGDRKLHAEGGEVPAESTRRPPRYRRPQRSNRGKTGAPVGDRGVGSSPLRRAQHPPAPAHQHPSLATPRTIPPNQQYITDLLISLSAQRDRGDISTAEFEEEKDAVLSQILPPSNPNRRRPRYGRRRVRVLPEGSCASRNSEASESIDEADSMRHITRDQQGRLMRLLDRRAPPSWRLFPASANEEDTNVPNPSRPRQRKRWRQRSRLLLSRIAEYPERLSDDDDDECVVGGGRGRGSFAIADERFRHLIWNESYRHLAPSATSDTKEPMPFMGGVPIRTSLPGPNPGAEVPWFKLEAPAAADLGGARSRRMMAVDRKHERAAAARSWVNEYY